MPPSADNCSICLESVVNRTIALNCGHVFCYACIRHWVRLHNRCPLCRTVIRQLLHQVTEPGSTFPVDRYEEVAVPEEMRGFIMNFDRITMVHAPMEEPLNVIQPIHIDNSLRVFYLLRVIEPGHTSLMINLNPNTLFILNENLAEVTEMLESSGIHRIEAFADHESYHPHASYLEPHSPHTIEARILGRSTGRSSP